MFRRDFLGLGISTTVISTAIQSRSHADLARMLADSRSRRAAIKQIVASRAETLPLLLEWAESPPPGVQRYDLIPGLAEAFGVLRAREGIPFLVANAAVQEGISFPWTMKSDEVVLERLPAVKALLLIGPDATEPMIKQYNLECNAENRHALLHAISRMKDARAKGSLDGRVAEASWELLAEEGLERLRK